MTLDEYLARERAGRRDEQPARRSPRVTAVLQGPAQRRAGQQRPLRDRSARVTVSGAAAGPHRHRRRRAEPAQPVPLPGHARTRAGATSELPSRDERGRQRLSNPPLALDLHYLLTAYGADDLDAEILLGYAMQLLHETPVLTRAGHPPHVQRASPVTDKLMPAVGARPQPGRPRRSGRAVQDRRRGTSPPTSCRELWSAMQARYRPSMAYDGVGRADRSARRRRARRCRCARRGLARRCR